MSMNGYAFQRKLIACALTAVLSSVAHAELIVAHDNDGKNFEVKHITGSTIEVTGGLIGKEYGTITNYTQQGATNGVLALAGGTVNLGTTDTQAINVNVTGGWVDGLCADGGVADGKHPGGRINVKANALNVKVHRSSANGYAYGIRAMTRTTDFPDNKLAVIDIQAKQTNIVVTGEKGVTTNGIAAWSQGQVLINNGDLYVEADNALNTRGNSLIQINATGGNHVVQLKGDIVFRYSTDSGTTINSNVDLVLSNENSYLKGNIHSDSNVNPIPSGKDNVSGMKLTLANGALWELTDDSFVNTLTLDKGNVVVASQNADVKVDELHGTGGGIALYAMLNDDQTLTTGHVKIDQVVGAPTLKVEVEGLTADDVTSGKTAIESLQGKVTANGATITNVIQEGDINGAISQTIDKNGTAGQVTEATNQKLDGYSSIAALSAVQWRHETDTLLKRMGELRDAEGTVGAWARIYGSEQEYGAQSVKAKNTTIQVGSDYDIGAGWKVGGAFSYTDGSSTFDRGQSDNKMYGLSLYGTYLADNGLFFDLIGKYSRLSNDFTSGTMKGDFDNNAFSLAAETGWHYAFNTLGFVEPSVGVTYGRIMGDDFVADNGVKVEQDDYDSLIGRVGVRGGFYFPEQKGNIYARVAVLHDFMGDMEATASKYNKVTGLNTSHLKEELGDTWIEYGIGANFKLAKNAYTFVDLEKTAGSDVKENWKWTIGARIAF